MTDTKHRDTILRRMERQAVALGGDFVDCPYPGEPRWRVSEGWVEFECGCRAQRCRRFRAPLRQCDPVVFRGLPEQALYDHVCHSHEAWMNSYRAKYGGFVDFAQWRRARFALLMGA